jgi:hypothetical protein
MGDWIDFRVGVDEVKSEYLLILGIDIRFVFGLIPG